MLAAAEKDVAHVPMILDHAPQLPFHLVVAVFENLLKLVEHHHHVQLALRRNLGRCLQHFIQRRPELGVLTDSERQHRLAFLVHRHAGSETAEKPLRRLQYFVHRGADGLGDGLGRSGDERAFAVGRPQIHIGADATLLRQLAERRPYQRGLAVAPLGEHEQLLVVLHRPQQIGDFLLPIAEGVSADHATVFKGVLHITQVALRNLRNTTAYPASKANSGLRVT